MRHRFTTLLPNALNSSTQKISISPAWWEIYPNRATPKVSCGQSQAKGHLWREFPGTDFTAKEIVQAHPQKLQWEPLPISAQ